MTPHLHAVPDAPSPAVTPPISCFAQDASFAGGSVGAAHAETIVHIQRLAGKARVPVIGFVESGGETRARLASALALNDGSERGARGPMTNIPLCGRADPEPRIV